MLRERLHEKVCEILREHALKIIDFKKKKWKLLRKGQQELYQNAKICKQNL